MAARIATAKVVHDDDVTFLERRSEYGFDIYAEGLAVNGAVEHPRRSDAVISKRPFGKSLM